MYAERRGLTEWGSPVPPPERARFRFPPGHPEGEACNRMVEERTADYLAAEERRKTIALMTRNAEVERVRGLVPKKPPQQKEHPWARARKVRRKPRVEVPSSWCTDNNQQSQ